MADGKRRNAKRRELPLKHKLVVIFTIAMAVIVAALWIVYALAAKPMYGALKISYAKDAARSVAENIDSVYLENLVDELSASENLCILLSDETGEDLYSSEVHGNRICMLHSIAAEDKIEYLETTAAAGGEYDEESLMSEDGSTLPDS